jgi:hypothetical protein
MDSKMPRNNDDLWKGIRDFDALHGWAFRLAQTPSNHAWDREGNPLPDDPNRISIVTPENESAWKDWKPANPDAVENMRSNWGSFVDDPEADYKKLQITRSAQHAKAATYSSLDKLGHQFK